MKSRCFLEEILTPEQELMMVNSEIDAILSGHAVTLGPYPSPEGRLLIKLVSRRKVLECANASHVEIQN